MIQIYTDDTLSYDSRLGGEYDLRGLKITTGVNKGGTAEIVLPPNHPAYDSFISYKTTVKIYKDSLLKFRGRVLYTSDDFYKQRTVLCEGELCFLQDAVSRPYLYQDTPANVFIEVIKNYNSQVANNRQFNPYALGITDSNNYIRLESETAEDVLTTINKLIERCGGHIYFRGDSDPRIIAWEGKDSYRSSQTIEFGENLLDFSSSGANTSLATAVLPYGAKDEETGERITIESVNSGKDYLVDEEAKALRGFIIKPVYWDDVTVPANLLTKAAEWLGGNRYIVTSLSLTALDLSYVDKSIDTFQVGDEIRVYSPPHGIDEYFLLTERTEDLLQPDNDRITLGKDKSSLTGASVAGDKQSSSELHKVKHDIKADYTLGISQAVQATEKTMESLISQESTKILTQVSETFATNDQVDSKISTSMTQTKEDFTFEFDTLEKKVDENDGDNRAKFEEINKYIRFVDGNIELGNSESAITLTIENDLIVFKKNGAQFGWWDGVDFHTGNIVIEVNERAQFGNFAFVPQPNGSLSFLKVGG